ncbi:MAG TPA: acyltransferase family protein [Bacillota bacterium]|nr:acyltransferase family protein [Bacillota bacterium]HPT86277.1 acyltransferase family protein [Bacillota bacterium]
MKSYQETKDSRIFFIDWLRVLATFAVFFFHVGRFFDEGGWHVKAEKSYIGMILVTGFTCQWLMPLFFVLSAAAVYYSLQHRSPSKFLWERLKRIFLPFVFVCWY